MDNYEVKKVGRSPQNVNRKGSGSDDNSSNLSSNVTKSIKFDRRRDQHKVRTSPPKVLTIDTNDNFMPIFVANKTPNSRGSSDRNSYTNISQNNSAFVSPENKKY